MRARPTSAGGSDDCLRSLWPLAALLRLVEPVFMSVRVGDGVLVETPGTDWWVGHVIHREGGARCNANSFFQIACVDTGMIRTVNADCVTAVVERRVEVPVRV